MGVHSSPSSQLHRHNDSSRGYMMTPSEYQISVEVMFLQAPGLDFDLHGAANFLDLPGLHGMIRNVVTEAVKTQLVYPNKVTILTLTVMFRVGTLGNFAKHWKIPFASEKFDWIFKIHKHKQIFGKCAQQAAS